MRITSLTGSEIFRFVWTVTLHRHMYLARMVWFYEWLGPRVAQFNRISLFDDFVVFSVGCLGEACIAG
jgi:hypothetical protein